ncbi:MAG: hypothetical protein ACQSGP_00170, partial [Frankia sp.]
MTGSDQTGGDDAATTGAPRDGGRLGRLPGDEPAPPAAPGRRMVLIGGTGVGVVSEPVALGASVVHIQQTGRTTGDQRALAAETHPVDLATGGQAVVDLALAAHIRAPLSAVVSMTELGLVPAARIAALLGLPGASNEAT